MRFVNGEGVSTKMYDLLLKKNKKIHLIDKTKKRDTLCGRLVLKRESERFLISQFCEVVKKDGSNFCRDCMRRFEKDGLQEIKWK